VYSVCRRVFVIGGTGFIGPHVIRRLAAVGHHVTVLHRGKTSAELPSSVEHLIGERGHISDLAKNARVDVVLDMICATERDGLQLVEAFEGRAGRSVVLSSADVYLAHDILHNKAGGPLQPTPNREDDALRRSRYPFRGVPFEAYEWISDDYDKILVEEAIAQSTKLPTTILRLPMVYGPRDPLRRFRPYLKQMDEGAVIISLDDSVASWRGCWGYVGSVASAIALAVTDERASGRTYNVADQDTLTYLGWLQELASVARWTGRIVPTPKDRLAPELVVPFHSAQNWDTDTNAD
jgi:nucleoside-diphosphate-sugar epimerase